MFQLDFTPEAVDDLRAFRVYDRARIIATIEAELPHQPTDETRNRKRLRPNQLSEWVLRVADYRVFYDANAQAEVVTIRAVGVKQGSKLFVHGQEYEL